jgi:hypothetical protein
MNRQEIIAKLRENEVAFARVASRMRRCSARTRAATIAPTATLTF